MWAYAEFMPASRAAGLAALRVGPAVDADAGTLQHSKSVGVLLPMTSTRAAPAPTKLNLATDDNNTGERLKGACFTVRG